jgi:ferredoxin
VPSSVAALPDVISQQQLRTFHISGRGIEHAIPPAPLYPADLDEAPLTRLESSYPVYVSAQFALTPFAGRTGGDAPTQADPEAIIAAFRNAVPVKDLIAVAEVRGQVLSVLERLPEADAKALNKAIPQDGWLIPFTANALPLFYAATVATTRHAAKERFVEKLSRQCERLRELLRLDDSHSPAGSSPEVISASMGAEAGYFDADILATAFHRKANATHRMDPKRRERVEAILATLENAIGETNREPSFWLFHSATAPASATAFGGRLRQSGDSFEAALEFCDQRLERFARYLRAMRAARLEVESAFDPAVHEEWLQRFDWQSAEPEELAALPAFVVLEPAEWLARTSFASFGRLLRSGRPVQILIPYHGLQNHNQDGDLSGFMPDFGYLSIAHREAFVLQSSLAQLDHLTAGLSAMTRSLRPAVAVVSVPPARETDANETNAWLESSLLLLSRTFPLYRYDPDRGESWMERFELQSGPPPGALTAAHAAAVSSEFRRHFRIVPDSGWNEEQMELTEYLERYRQTPPLAIPFIRVVDEQGNRQRAVITRELVNLSRDRQRAFRIFEELSGVKNAHVEAAVVRTREEVHTQVRREGATEAIYRVIAMLTDGQAFAAVEASQASPAPVELSAPLTSQNAEAEQISDDPYIDTFLCTSCNDCMKVNAQMFQYDANKQASIGNARAGTFAELVKAAEGCPAKCIHPGTPRPDDATATSGVRARAAKFR